MTGRSIRLVSSSDQVLQTLTWARKQQFKPVALHQRSKAAVSRAYVEPDYAPPADDLWRTNEHGVGVVTGPLHSGPVDIDLDCDEAVYFAPLFLPPTDAVFGRSGKRASHYLYRVDAPSFDKRAFNDPCGGELRDKEVCVIEARGDGGHQTVLPGSVHETTGELIEWEKVPFPDVPLVNADELMRAVRKVAIATLIVRHIWQAGYHNEPCKHLSGMLFYLDWTQDEAEQLIRAVADYCGDKDKSRLPTVRSTFKRAASGKKVSGAGLLRKQINNDRLIDRILEFAGSVTVNLIQEYNERFAAVTIGGKFRIADTDQPPGESPNFYTKDDFLNVVGTDFTVIEDKPVLKGKLWLGNPRRRAYRSVDFVPGSYDADVLNLWGGWAVQPKQGDCEAWIELVRDVICGGDKELFKWTRHWFANIVREPVDKSMTSLVVIGPEGAGKSLMLGYFGRIIGPSYVAVTKEDHLVGKFNSHMGNTLLLHSEEALYGGDKRHAGIIRSLITDPWHMFEAKGIDARKVRNYLRLALTSNDIYAAPARPGDRRYTVIDMGDRKATPELIERVLAEMNGDGPAALFHELLEMKYDPTIPRTNVKNEALMSLKAINLSPIEAWWYETLQTGQVLPDYLNWATRPEKIDWPQVVSSRALHVAMMLELRGRNSRMIPTERLLAYQLDKFMGVRLARGQREFDNPMLDEYPPAVRMLGSRQSAILNMPDLETCRTKFTRYLGQPVDWPKPDDTPKQPKGDQPHDNY